MREVLSERQNVSTKLTWEEPLKPEQGNKGCKIGQHTEISKSKTMRVFSDANQGDEIKKHKNMTVQPNRKQQRANVVLACATCSAFLSTNHHPQCAQTWTRSTLSVLPTTKSHTASESRLLGTQGKFRLLLFRFRRHVTHGTLGDRLRRPKHIFGRQLAVSQQRKHVWGPGHPGPSATCACCQGPL